MVVRRPRVMRRWNECDVCHGQWGYMVCMYSEAVLGPAHRFFHRFGRERLCPACTGWAESLGLQHQSPTVADRVLGSQTVPTN